MLQCTEVTEVVSLAVTAAQCMRQVRVGLEKKEFTHPKANTLTEKVHTCMYMYFCGCCDLTSYVCRGRL